MLARRRSCHLLLITDKVASCFALVVCHAVLRTIFGAADVVEVGARVTAGGAIVAAKFVALHPLLPLPITVRNIKSLMLIALRVADFLHGKDLHHPRADLL